MHGKDNDGRSHDRETAILDQKLLSAFHVRLLRLETEIESISQALSMRERLSDKVSDRTEGLRREAATLRGMIQTFAGDARIEPDHDIGAMDATEQAARSFAPPPPRPEPAPTPASGSRAGRLTARRWRGVRFQARVDIWDHDLEALIRCGELSAGEANDPVLVADAVEDIFDRLLQHRLGTAPATPQPPTPPRASPVRPPVIKPAKPAEATPSLDNAPETDDERRRNPDRRAGLERRDGDDRRNRGLDAGSDEWGILIDDAGWGGPDVRSRDDRRSGDDRRGSERRRVVGPFS